MVTKRIDTMKKFILLSVFLLLFLFLFSSVGYGQMNPGGPFDSHKRLLMKIHFDDSLNNIHFIEAEMWTFEHNLTISETLFVDSIQGMVWMDTIVGVDSVEVQRARVGWIDVDSIFVRDTLYAPDGRIDTIFTDFIYGQTRLHLNPSADSNVVLFSDAGTIGNVENGKRLIIYRNETGDVDSLEFYIDRYSNSYIVSSEGLIFNTATGLFQFLQGGYGFELESDRYTKIQLLFRTSSVIGNAIVVGDDRKDYDHPVQSQPTQFWHSALDPDISNNDFVGIRHDSLNGAVIFTGNKVGAGTVPKTTDNSISLFPRDSSRGLTVDGDGNWAAATFVVTG